MRLVPISTKMITLCTLLALNFISLQGKEGTAIATDFTRSIQFAKGKNSAIIDGGVVRADADIYLLHAKDGQKMAVQIGAVEDNAVIQILSPKKRYLPGAGEYDDAKAWQGVLPVSGKYKIIVRGARGNATYQLKIVIEP